MHQNEMHHLISLDPFSIFNAQFSGTPCLLLVSLEVKRGIVRPWGLYWKVAMKGSNSSTVTVGTIQKYSNLLRSIQIYSKTLVRLHSIWHIVSPSGRTPVLPTDSGGLTQCGFASGTGHASELRLAIHFGRKQLLPTIMEVE